MAVRSFEDKIQKTLDLLDQGASDRKSLSEHLGISLSGAGNLISELRSHGIIGEYIKRDGVSGKKSGHLYLKSDPVFAICCIDPDKITASFFGHNLKISDSFTQKITDPLFLDDCLISYFRTMNRICPKLKHLCITADGRINNGCFFGSPLSSLDGLPLITMASEFLPKTNISIDSSNLWVPDENNGMNAVITEICDTVSVSLVYNGDMISNQNIRIGETEDINRRLFNSKIRYADSSHEYIAAMASLIDSVLSLVRVDRVYLFTGRYNSIMTVFNEIISYLMLYHSHSFKTLPQFFPVNVNIIAPDRLRRHIRNTYIRSLFEP